MTKKTYIKIFVYITLAIIAFIVVKYSKKYFEENYQQHQTIESNLNIYKVNVNEEIKEQPSQPKVVEQNPVEVHTEPTAVIMEEDLLQNISTEEDTNNSKEDNQTTENPEITDNDESKESTKIKNQQSEKKPEIKKVEKAQPKEIKKPKTLEKPSSVSKSVLKNPLFQSYVIQVGAFTNKKEADIHRIRISKNKIASQYRTEVNKTKNKELYKVIIGYFESSDAAKNVCSQLKQQNVQCFATKI